MRRLFQNNTRVLIGSAVGLTDQTIVLVPGQGSLISPIVPGVSFMSGTLIKKSGSGQILEIIDIIDKQADVLTVIRARENTTAQTFGSGDFLEIRLTAQALTEFLVGPIDGGSATSH